MQCLSVFRVFCENCAIQFLRHIQITLLMQQRSSFKFRAEHYVTIDRSADGPVSLWIFGYQIAVISVPGFPVPTKFGWLAAVDYTRENIVPANPHEWII